MQALFAYNRTQQIGRERELTALQQLAWLPKAFNAQVLTVLNTLFYDHAGYTVRVETLRSLWHELLKSPLARFFRTPVRYVGRLR